MSDIDHSPFLALRRHLTIAHHIPGRIGLRVEATVVTELGSPWAIYELNLLG